MAAWPQSSLILHNRRLEEIKSIPKWESGNQIAAEVVIPQKHLKSEIESLVNQKKGVDKSLVASGVCFLVSYNVVFDIRLTWETVRINKRSFAALLTRTCRSHVFKVLLHNRIVTIVQLGNVDWNFIHCLKLFHTYLPFQQNSSRRFNP